MRLCVRGLHPWQTFAEDATRVNQKPAAVPIANDALADAHQPPRLRRGPLAQDRRRGPRPRHHDRVPQGQQIQRSHAACSHALPPPLLQHWRGEGGAQGGCRHYHRAPDRPRRRAARLPAPGEGRRRHGHARRWLGLDRGRREGGAACQDWPRQRWLLPGRGRRQAARRRRGDHARGARRGPGRPAGAAGAAARRDGLRRI